MGAGVGSAYRSPSSESNPAVSELMFWVAILHLLRAKGQRLGAFSIHDKKVGPPKNKCADTATSRGFDYSTDCSIISSGGAPLDALVQKSDGIASQRMHVSNMPRPTLASTST